MPIIVPPIKCQGIKTKIVPTIKENMPKNYNIWYEPFMGSGVVGFNVQPKVAIFSDTNPHLINFYNDIKNDFLDFQNCREYLEKASKKLSVDGETYYKTVRERFNSSPNSFDFLFLNRCCFNGMIRFNSKGNFNVPFCKKNNRLSKAYITKICNQIKNVSEIIHNNDYKFICCDFSSAISNANKNDFIYCDPPYIDRFCDYFNSWNENDETRLFDALSNANVKFILSTWHHNQYRQNIYIDKMWTHYNVKTIEHFYQLGAKENNRHSMTEAIVIN